ncbi:putative Regulatory protein, FmdB family [Nitrospina gracilis 3/211]|uniref:Putative Regulatory protein, FmdB family n=1 Tax=Nitrospina gracilis (strain 3/211) TaxID=1266370 RepID=M1YFH9_NITG3|nr:MULTISPECIES: zinc ribbon domain-containing protein [Nitrospina]MCF8722340.1 putative FmdB family regulatory protein [Nitrospina sp. Nb-3]CCQ89180.1 putative Regulatory protein, FmdB family [Nitrospina gracilis 3/211]
MPIYEYECESCGTTFELMQSINAKAPKQCETPKCQGKPRRKISASGFILKGSGWYATDYPSESRKKGWEAESKQGNGNGAAAPSGESCSSPGCSNPATTTAPKPKSNPIAEANKNPYSGSKKKAKKSGAKSTN